MLPFSFLKVWENIREMHACLVAQSCPTPCDPMECSQPGSSVNGDSPGENTGLGCHALSSRDLPDPGIKLMIPTLQAYSLPSEPPGKHKYIYLSYPFHS